MKYAVFAYSKRGCGLALRTIEYLKEKEGTEIHGYTMEKYADGEMKSLPDDRKALYGEMFRSCDAMIFFGALGIAVRHIAPFIESKVSDPAVICIDELGKNIIPVLSGHIGGANKLAEELADLLKGNPVITTATDINGRFAVDSWAKEQGLIIDSMEAAKKVSAAVLERDIPVISELEMAGRALPGVFLTYETDMKEAMDTGIYIGREKRCPFENTLRLIPKDVHLGIGCRKGIFADSVEEAVRKVLDDNNIDIRAVKCASSIDIKSDEEGLLEAAGRFGWPVSFYSGDELGSLKGEFSGSDFVKKITGVDNVCERSALMGAERLIINKTAVNGVTVAAAVEKGGLTWEK